MAELLKYKDFVHPPPIDELRRQTEEAFSHKYIKYMYSRFKNECPTGRMRITEFKQMFGGYVPERLTEDYLMRLFNAFSKSKSEITFQDLMDALATLNAATPRSNAIWTIRMIKGRDDTRVDFHEFSDFVKSVYQLSNKNDKKGSTTGCSTDRKCTMQAAATRRAEETFNSLDADCDGYINLEDLTNFFEQVNHMDRFVLRRSTVDHVLGSTGI